MTGRQGHNAARPGSGEAGFQRRSTTAPETELAVVAGADTSPYRISPGSILAGRAPADVDSSIETWATCELTASWVDDYDGKVREVVTARLYRYGNNPTPHFSLVHSLYAGRRTIGGGAGHADILSRHPELAAVARVHLADDLGRPMHAADNARYWAGGGVLKPESDTPVETDEYGTWNPQALAQHLRVSVDDARALRGRVVRREFDVPAVEGRTERAEALSQWEAACDELAPRWRAEAEDALAVIDRLSSAN